MPSTKIIGNEVLSNNKITSQVYQATHDGAGNRLPHMSRSFISFTFGGKAIEDFGLIVVTAGDRIERQAYAEFNDLTSEYDVLNGQLYWGSTISANKLELDLATDEITEQQLDNFREWFSPGKERELILSEHPNRAIRARVESAPSLSLLPFEKKTSLVINGISYDTSTTIYKGEVTLSFVMDDPYWYSKLNYMPTYVNKMTLEKAEGKSSSNNNIVNTLEDKDTLKIMLEDGIPHQSTLIGDNTSTFFLGGNHLVTKAALVGVSRVNDSYIGIITGESSGLTVNSSIPQYLFYSGTAKSYPKIKFTITPHIDSYPDQFFPGYTGRYATVPKNTYARNITNEQYSYIAIDDKKFYFTTPSVLTGFNKALYLFKKVKLNSSSSVTDLITELRETIHERYSRSWAIACVQSLGVNTLTEQNQKLYLLNNMAAFLLPENSFLPNSVVGAHADSNVDPIIVNQIKNMACNPFTFTVDSKTGEVLCTMKIRTIDLSSTASNLILKNKIITVTENVGDMVRSDYLVIEGRNYLNSNGEIELENCHKISSNENLTDVLVFFDNMYL